MTEQDRVYVVDITYVATGKGWLYLAVFLYLFLRLGMGWGLSAWMSTELVMDALQMARWCPCPGKGLLVHSGQYASGCFQVLLKNQG